MKTILSAIMFLSICVICDISRAEENVTPVVQTQPVTSNSLDKTEELSPESAIQPVTPEGPLSPIELERNRRKEERHKIRVHRLKLAMQREGNEYSEEKYRKYRARLGGGITLAAIGVVSVLASFVAAVGIGFDRAFPIREDDDIVDYSDADYEAQKLEEKRLDRKSTIAKSFFFGGLATVIVSLPLIISGFKGQNRQNYIQRKDQIMVTKPPTLKVSILANPENRSGGLALTASF